MIVHIYLTFLILIGIIKIRIEEVNLFFANEKIITEVKK